MVEVRHASWDVDSFYEFLRGHGVAFCNVDQPLIGKSIRPGERVTAPLGYFRLHGRAKTWFRRMSDGMPVTIPVHKPEIADWQEDRTVRENAKKARDYK